MQVDIKNTRPFKAAIDSLGYFIDEKADEKDIAHINSIFESYGLDITFELNDKEVE